MSAVNRVLLELQEKAEEGSAANPADMPASQTPDAQRQTGDPVNQVWDDPTTSTAEGQDQDQTSQCQPMETQLPTTTAVHEQVREQIQFLF